MNMAFSALGEEFSNPRGQLTETPLRAPFPAGGPLRSESPYSSSLEIHREGGRATSSWWHVANVVISSSMFVVVFVTFVLICILCGELSRTLGDVKEMMPEVARVLSIVIQLCDIPEVAPYCGDGDSIGG